MGGTGFLTLKRVGSLGDKLSQFFVFLFKRLINAPMSSKRQIRIYLPKVNLTYAFTFISFFLFSFFFLTTHFFKSQNTNYEN